MNRKPFLYIFAGVIAAGVLFLGVGLAVHFGVSGNAVATVVSLFAMIAGGIMAAIGLISLLVCLLFVIFGKKKSHEEEEQCEVAELTSAEREVETEE